MARNSTLRSSANGSDEKRVIQYAIYTRKSTEEGLQQEFNSLDAQREAAEAFIVSQKNEGWQVISDHFDDGGYTGSNMDRPAIQRLLAAVESLSAGPARNPLPGSGFQGDEATVGYSRPGRNTCPQGPRGTVEGGA